jgi:hypothetical protein
MRYQSQLMTGATHLSSQIAQKAEIMGITVCGRLHLNELSSQLQWDAYNRMIKVQAGLGKKTRPSLQHIHSKNG